MVEFRVPTVPEITGQILRANDVPEYLRLPDNTARQLHVATEWIDERMQSLLRDGNSFQIRKVPIQEYSGFMLIAPDSGRIVFGEQASPADRIAITLNLLAKYHAGLVDSDDRGEQAYAPLNRRELPSFLLEEEFRTDDLVRRGTLIHPEIASNTPIARALWRSFLPFVPAHPQQR